MIIDDNPSPDSRAAYLALITLATLQLRLILHSHYPGRKSCWKRWGFKRRKAPGSGRQRGCSLPPICHNLHHWSWAKISRTVYILGMCVYGNRLNLLSTPLSLVEPSPAIFPEGQQQFVLGSNKPQTTSTLPTQRRWRGHPYCTYWLLPPGGRGGQFASNKAPRSPWSHLSSARSCYYCVCACC